jgi:hypothetical protein
MTTSRNRAARTHRGRALERAQRLATKLAALPLERSALPDFKRLAGKLLARLDDAGVLPAHAKCADCDEARNECCCDLYGVP